MPERLPEDLARPSGRSRITTVVLGAALISAFFFLVEGKSVKIQGAEAILLLIWWMTPYGVYFAIVRTAAGARLIGLHLILVTLILLSTLYAQEDAQAGLGLITIPAIIYLLLGSAFAVEGLVLRRASRQLP